MIIQAWFSPSGEYLLIGCILIDAQNLSMKKIILNCILQLINVTFGFGDPHNTQTKLVPAQPFYRASN